MDHHENRLMKRFFLIGKVTKNESDAYMMLVEHFKGKEGAHF